MQTIFGLEPGLAQVPSEDQASALKASLEALDQNRPFNFEYRVLGLNQEWGLVKAQALVIK
jgi:hypothetical protein